MGTLSSKTSDIFSSKSEFKILMLGLDASGKTTIVYKLKPGEVVDITPMFAFNLEIIKYDNLHIHSWDISTAITVKRFKPLWYPYFAKPQGLIFVVDSNDSSRFDEAKEILQALLDSEELENVPVLIFANKNDLVDLNEKEFSEKFGVNTLGERKFFIQKTCAFKGDGLTEGLDWLSKILSSK